MPSLEFRHSDTPRGCSLFVFMTLSVACRFASENATLSFAFEIREIGFLFRSSILYYYSSILLLVRRTSASAVFDFLFVSSGFRNWACFASSSKFQALHCIFEISCFSLYFRNLLSFYVFSKFHVLGVKLLTKGKTGLVVPFTPLLRTTLGS